jgi:chorismate lyase
MGVVQSGASHVVGQPADIGSVAVEAVGMRQRLLNESWDMLPRYDHPPMLARPHRLPSPVRSGALRSGARPLRGYTALPGPLTPLVPSNAWWKRTWLRAGGSLTARLRHLGNVQVHVQTQGARALWPSEQEALGCRSGHVREVILSVDGLPVVWARSATSHGGLKGPWKALQGLGSRALAELLFSHTQVRRGPLVVHAWRKHGPAHARAARQWLRFCHQPNNQAPQARRQTPWHARASVFWHKGQPLRVMEAFNPVLARWQRSV